MTRALRLRNLSASGPFAERGRDAVAAKIPIFFLAISSHFLCFLFCLCVCFRYSKYQYFCSFALFFIRFHTVDVNKVSSVLYSLNGFVFLCISDVYGVLCCRGSMNE